MSELNLNLLKREKEVFYIFKNHPFGLPDEIILNIVKYIYSYRFKNKKELKKAISRYSKKKENHGKDRIYGNSNFWDVSQITDMYCLFYDSNFNGDISNWDVSRVVNMYSMFKGSTFNGDISNWDVSSVNNMSCMFCKSEFNGDISNWDVTSVIDKEFIFYRSRLTPTMSPFNIEDSEYIGPFTHDIPYENNIFYRCSYL